MLTDFGVAKIIETDETMDQTGLGVGIGTPDYMAPEQWEGKEIRRTGGYLRPWSRFL